MNCTPSFHPHEFRVKNNVVVDLQNSLPFTPSTGFKTQPLRCLCPLSIEKNYSHCHENLNIMSPSPGCHLSYSTREKLSHLVKNYCLAARESRSRNRVDGRLQFIFFVLLKYFWYMSSNLKIIVCDRDKILTQSIFHMDQVQAQY